MSSSDWKKYKLGELGKLARGKSKHRPRDAAFLYGGPYPFIQTGDIKSANHKITKYHQTYSDAGLAQSKLWAEGTIAITIAANIADTSILTFPACFPDSVLGFIADKEKCDIDFIEYLLQYYKKQIQSHAVGSVQDNINLGTFENIEFDVPSLPTQRRIAYILSALDEKIELNRQVNTTLESMAQAIFKEWFVEFNYPDTTGDVVESDLGLIPWGWRVGKLGGEGDFKNGINYARDDHGDTEFAIVNVRNIVESKFINKKDLTSIMVDELKALPYLLEADDILLVRSASPGEVAILLQPEAHVIYSGFTIRYRLVKKEYFLYMFFIFQAMKERLNSLSNGTTLKNINQELLKPYPVVIPSVEIVIEFNKRIIPIFESIQSNIQQTAILASIRDTLLPKLMSGEIEVDT